MIPSETTVCSRAIRLLLARIGVFLALALLLGTASHVMAQEDAAPLLETVVQRMGEVESFEFELTTVRGRSTIMQNLELAGVVGSVQRPDRFEATITARVAIIEVDVEVIGIGDQIWVTDPLAPEKSYIEISGAGANGAVVTEALTDLINPDRILLTAVGLVEEPTIDGMETVNGVQTTRVVGTVDLRVLPQFGGGTPEAGSDFLLLQEMPITIWIDDENRVVSIEIEGPLTADESPNVVRRLDLRNFDEPVEIVPPDVAS